MEGSVKGMEEESLSFIYKNETIVYKVKQSDIVKITPKLFKVDFLRVF